MVTSAPGGMTATGTASPITVTGLTAGQSYRFTVKATNALGYGPESALSNSALLTIPTAPTTFTAVASILSTNPQTVTLHWTDTSSNEAGFTIQRSTTSGFTSGNTTIAVGANVMSFVDTTVAQRTRYYYRVQSTNALGNSTWSNVVNALTVGQLPMAPTNLHLVSATTSSIAIAWTDNASNESGFYVESSPNGTTSWSRISTLGVNVTTYTQLRLRRNVTVWYRVRAYNASGASTYSNVISTKTLP
jgi:titin